jgi:hypothetical protein
MKFSHDQVEKAIGNFLFYSNQPFTIARSPYWQAMVDGFVVCSWSFSAPSFEALKKRILIKIVQDIGKSLQNIALLRKIQVALLCSVGGEMETIE